MDAFREVVAAIWFHRYMYTEYDHITDWHEFTRIAFTCVPVEPMTMAGNATVVWADGANMIPEMIYVYTDGSSSEDAAAWSFNVVVALHNGQFRRCGFMMGDVILDKGHHQ